ncbi:MAG: hypothetical protein CL897_05840 [Dehalococcoidia bacterium]|nr:hypothetical protein [Dehalococcoidia bacterium]|tara:strand:- start:9073 stop:9891 length:819 start_codon:yes stop_codon:yes gene_type:complete
MSDESDTSVSITLGEALEEYLGTLAPEAHNNASPFVRRYVEHAGRDTVVASLTGARVESYAEGAIQLSDPAAPQRVAALKAWFQYLKKRSYVPKNYGVHIRLRRSAGRATAAHTVNEARIQMTAEGISNLQGELDKLEGEVPDLVKAISLAREDKDFRENAPLEAAREALAFNETRRREINATLRRAVAVDESGGADDRSAIGSIVQVTRLDNDRDMEYKLVSAREANASDRKISVESPVGKELLGRLPGDEVTVSVPSGVVQFRVTGVNKS